MCGQPQPLEQINAQMHLIQYAGFYDGILWPMFRFLPIILADHRETGLLRRFKVRCSLLLLLKANLFQLYRCLVAAQIGKALCQHLAMNFELMFVFKTMPCACFVHSPVALEYRCCLGLLALCGSLYFLTKSSKRQLQKFPNQIYPVRSSTINPNCANSASLPEKAQDGWIQFLQSRSWLAFWSKSNFGTIAVHRFVGKSVLVNPLESPVTRWWNYR